MRHFSCVLCALLFALFVSCTQNKIEIANSIICPVYSFETENDTPDCWLTAFVKTSGELGYLKLLRLYSEQTEYTWNISDFQYVCTPQGNWAGAAGICPPRYENIPSGKYKLTVVSSSSETAEISAFIKLQNEIASKNYKNFLSSKDYQKVLQQYIVFYDSNGAILFCDLQNNVQNIRETARHNSAVFARTLLIANDKSFAVLSPPQKFAETKTENK